MKIIVLDNFYDNLNQVVAYARTLDYRIDVAGGHFYRTVGIIPSKETSLCFENALVGKIDFNDDYWTVENDYDNFNGSFYYPPPRNDFGSGLLHVHHDHSGWVGILHLHDMGPGWGTQFWQHKESGQIATKHDMTGTFEWGTGHDPFLDGGMDAFIKTDYISSKYNRLLLYQGDSYHSVVIPDNASDEEISSRLNQIFNFNLL